MIYVDHFPDENGQTRSPGAKGYLRNHHFSKETFSCYNGTGFLSYILKILLILSLSFFLK